MSINFTSTELIAAAEKWWKLLEHKKFNKRAFCNGFMMGATVGVNGENLKELPAEAKGESGEAALREALDDCVTAFFLPGDHCEMEQAIERARALLAHKPAEERGPEEGDLVAYPFKANPKEIASVFFYEQKNDLKGTFYTDIAGPPIVLMRRAEVEARVKGGALNA